MPPAVMLPLWVLVIAQAAGRAAEVTLVLALAQAVVGEQVVVGSVGGLLPPLGSTPM